MAFRRRGLLLTMLLLVILAVGAVFLKALFPPDMEVERIVLVTIDTLRADHLGAYGYIQDTSPFFDYLATKGILFRNHVAPMATTVPSHAALFTSQYPIRLGVLENGHKLDSSVLTMAEAFQQIGYYTAATVSTVGQFTGSNLDQGFEYFSAPDKHSVPEGQVYRPAEETIQTAISFLSARDVNERFLLWVHVFDPHQPLRPPKAHRDTLHCAARELDLPTYWTETQRVPRDYFHSQRQMLNKITMYDAEIRYVDHELRRLYRFYRQQGFDHKSVWVITADHGEGVGNHRWWAHGKHIYNEQLRIPLLFYFSDGQDESRTIDTLVEIIDIYPTLLELVGNSAPVEGSPEGNSLLPLLFPGLGDGYPEGYAFSQRRVFEGPAPETVIPERTNYEKGDTFALQSNDHKYIYRTHGIDEFFDLRSDPYETTSLIGRGLEEEAVIRELLLETMAELVGEGSPEHVQVDEETRKQLRALGYFQ